MKPHFLEFKTKFYHPIEQVFDFFSHAENLNRVTPRDLDFTFLTPFPIKMQVGALIDYRIKLWGMPFFWRTQITGWEPPYFFIDEQAKGPYIYWQHQHIFEQKDGYVLMTDRLHYLSPGWFLEPLIDKVFITPQVKKIWAYREKQFKTIFGEKTEVDNG